MAEETEGALSAEEIEELARSLESEDMTDGEEPDVDEEG